MGTCSTSACSGPTRCHDCQWTTVSSGFSQVHFVHRLRRTASDPSMPPALRWPILLVQVSNRARRSTATQHVWSRGCTTWTSRDRGVLPRQVLLPSRRSKFCLRWPVRPPEMLFPTVATPSDSRNASTVRLVVRGTEGCTSRKPILSSQLLCRGMRARSEAVTEKASRAPRPQQRTSSDPVLPRSLLCWLCQSLRLLRPTWWTMPHAVPRFPGGTCHGRTRTRPTWLCLRPLSCPKIGTHLQLNRGPTNEIRAARYSFPLASGWKSLATSWCHVLALLPVRYCVSLPIAEAALDQLCEAEAKNVLTFSMHTSPPASIWQPNKCQPRGWIGISRCASATSAVCAQVLSPSLALPASRV